MSLTDLEAEASVPPASEVPGGKKIEGRSPWQLAWMRLRKDKAAMISLVVIMLLVLMALLAPLIGKWVGYAPDFGDRTFGQTAGGLPVGPNGHHILRHRPVSAVTSSSGASTERASRYSSAWSRPHSR